MTKKEILTEKSKYDFLYMKGKFTHCKRLETNPRLCLSCPCPQCFATQTPTAGEKEMVDKAIETISTMFACNK